MTGNLISQFDRTRIEVLHKDTTDFDESTEYTTDFGKTHNELHQEIGGVTREQVID